ncbi:hypothetical protein FCL40_02535 [Ferrimonas sediminicola]|uniref:Uncharacterized protein n=1 Tax=Ferrimonas sediminicola TaxID=2569538 RepID=A0A4V5NY63_9GAMM|nr:hypothetical protein [Ferrimonas sediminicola]TKB51451.1 hypothetical protein FCL40_02535 [Ferrimonas sediminicola]
MLSLVLTALLGGGAPMCDRSELPGCLERLPTPLVSALSQHWGVPPRQLGPTLERQLAGQGAVTLTLGRQALILTDGRRIAQPHILLVGHEVYELPSVHSLSLAVLHEQGHLIEVGEELRQPYRFAYWPEVWQEEVVADLYALWQLARRGELALGWDLVHLRNFNLMGAAPDWAHWTTPVLLPWLVSPERRQTLARLSFERVLATSVVVAADLPHFRTLGRRQFGPGRGAYPYVPPQLVERWWQLLTPSLSLLMGEDLAPYRQRQHRLMVAKSAN